MIQELREGTVIGKYQLLDTMQKLADNDAKRLEKAECMKEKSATMIICYFCLKNYRRCVAGSSKG